MYPRRRLSFGHPHGLIEHIGIGPGQQGHLPLCVTSNATFWERAQSLWQIQIKRKTNFCNRVTESLTLMVSSNQSLFPYSLADIQDSSSHVSYFHTKSKTLLENDKTRGINDAPLSMSAPLYHCCILALPGPSDSPQLAVPGKGTQKLPCKPTWTAWEPATKGHRLHT